MLKTGTQPEILFQAAAYIGNCIFKAVEDHKICSLVLAGGNSPRQLYRMLAGGIPVSALQKQGFGFPEKEVIN
ncbi:MAG: 6-phosphogluconolactonase, partial [Chlorobiales bacterium]|nr:6-phosphogluconolactonase [Chlorobiales bacterium]